MFCLLCIIWFVVVSNSERETNEKQIVCVDRLTDQEESIPEWM